MTGIDWTSDMIYTTGLRTVSKALGGYSIWLAVLLDNEETVDGIMVSDYHTNKC